MSDNTQAHDPQARYQSTVEPTHEYRAGHIDVLIDPLRQWSDGYLWHHQDDEDTGYIDSAVAQASNDLRDRLSVILVAIDFPPHAEESHRHAHIQIFRFSLLILLSFSSNESGRLRIQEAPYRCAPLPIGV